MLVNLTPHAINIITNERTITIPPSGTIARCRENVEYVGEFDGVQIVRKTFGTVENLPAPKEGVVYIVSALVAQAARRDDVMCPGEPVRDAEGRIIGCKALCRV